MDRCKSCGYYQNIDCIECLKKIKNEQTYEIAQLRSSINIVIDAIKDHNFKDINPKWIVSILTQNDA